MVIKKRKKERLLWKKGRLKGKKKKKKYVDQKEGVRRGGKIEENAQRFGQRKKW